MSNAPQGPGWWQASDGNWYPPQPEQSLQEGADNAGSDLEGVHRRPRRWIFVALTLLIVILIGVIVAATGSKSPKAAPSTTSTTDLVLSASNSYEAAFNKMIDAINAQLPTQNNATSDPADAATAINTEAEAVHAFDSTVQAIDFPPADRHDVAGVLSAGSAYESALGTLAANTSDIPNYNSVFDTVSQAQSSFSGANTVLGNDLGLTFTGSTPTTAPAS